MTVVRPSAEDLEAPDLELTAKRRIDPVPPGDRDFDDDTVGGDSVTASDAGDGDDEDDASETQALLGVQQIIALEIDPHAFSDLEPTALKQSTSSSVRPAAPSKAQQSGTGRALPLSAADIRPQRGTVPPPDALRPQKGTIPPQRPPRPERAPSPDLPPQYTPPPIPPTAAGGLAGRLSRQHAVRLEDANAFADSEPTSLKQTSAPGVEDRPTAHLSPAELGLLSAMSEGHEPSRLKYVDWLDRRGESARAEFLRLDYALASMSSEHPRYEATRRRLVEVAPRISVDWRSRVARSLIENCTAYGAGCPAYWRALPSTSDDVRGCAACGDQVYYCVTIDLARARVAQGQRVAIDATCDRYIGDLEPVCVACHLPVPANNRFCPQCGHAR